MAGFDLQKSFVKFNYLIKFSEICRTRKTIAAIGDNSDPLKQKISNKISEYFYLSPELGLKFKDFSSIEEVNSYVENENYGLTENQPFLCFGYSFKKIDSDNYDYTLHYFDSELRGAIQDIPTTLIESLDPFQSGPDMPSFERWLNSGYLLIMKIINEVILQSVTGKTNSEINYVVMAEKYSSYREDQFGPFIGFILPFFIIIAYVCPLCILVFRMVKEKETKAKEGMKIMGLKEYIYFLSFFLHWIILNTIYAVINSAILTRVLQNTGFIYIFAFFWLFGMTVFSLAYFFQSLMDKTRIAIIISILVYFVMFFVSVAVLSEDVENIPKMFISLLPPTALQLGLTVLSKYEANFIKFGSNEVSSSYNNFSVGNMYLMLFIDIFLYLILGYLFDHIIPHQYGIGLWCKKKSKLNLNEIKKNDNKVNYIKIDVDNKKNGIKNSDYSTVTENQDYFQSEQNYEDKIKSGDCFRIRNLKKVFDDGKVAVNGLNLNLYNQEIFALLGHNGAGKSTTISILSGLYEATEGSAFYKNMDVLESGNMDKFRSKLGICPQHDVLFENLSVKEHLNMFCIFKGVESKAIAGEIEKTLFDMQLNDIQNELAKNLSGGQKRRLSIAIALIGGSEVVFLDEPSSGMDITSRRNLWEILKKCVEKRIIVLTTHYMEEAAILGNRIGIVSNGKLKCCGNSLFLIDRLGKYISLDIYPNKDAKPEKILKFVSDRIPGVVSDALPEKILFRIPKTEQSGDKKMVIKKEENSFDFNLKEFFSELDKNLDILNIKTYGVSMPTLEDVFLNLSAENKNHINNKEKIDIFKNQKIENYTVFAKFVIDLKSSLKKRFLQILRDRKSFLLEILCPIILVLIGLGVSSVQFIKNSPAVSAVLQEFPSGQKIIINTNEFETYLDKNNAEYLYKELDPKITGFSQAVTYYNNLILDQKLENSYGSFLVWKNNEANSGLYEFVTFTNTQARNAPVIYSQYMMNLIHSHAAGRRINVNHKITPFPITNRIRTRGQTRNNSNLVFFVSIAFALIPANFITIIIKERESNTKHLQIVSGIRMISYWLSNFIFELTKYYFIGGISLLLILAFDRFPPYLWLLYLLYGFAMTAFTYMISLIFKTESSAQNMVLLLNLLFGALGGSVIIILRILEDLVNIGKIIAYVLRVIPSFSFAYGFNQLLSAQLLYYVDNKDIVILTPVESYMNNLDYAGMDSLYMGVEFFFYMTILFLLERFKNSCRRKTNPYKNLHSSSQINDSIVMQEIEKANLDGNDSKYSLRVKNLEKVYKKGLCGGQTKAVNNLSFCLEKGECFALIGVNGAGKTTTFKALTCEHLPTGGEIFVNGIELTQNFDKVRNLIGYCPQFDAIFDYMTVKENLEFYANIKGIKKELIQDTVNELMTEMNLTEYEKKISGNLSGGNKRKLSVAIAMIGNPPIILLDEPSTGMDPEARRFMWDVIGNISTRNKSSSVILTTHSMEEAENLCRRIGIMVNGQFKCLGTSQVIKDKYGFGYEIDLRINNLPDKVLSEYIRISNINPNDFLQDLNAIKNSLSAIKKHQYFSLIEQSKLGLEIIEEVIFILIILDEFWC